MPKVTTVSGVEVSFDPDAISWLTPGNVNGGITTKVYGFMPDVMQIQGKPEEFLASLGLAPRFCSLTRPDGSQLWLRGSAVAYLMPSLPGENEPPVKSIVGIGASEHGVTEDMATAKAAINRARGPASQL